MQRLLVFVRKDLLRTLRQPTAALLLLAFPLVFAGMLAMTFGTSGSPTVRAHVLVEDRDNEGIAGGFLASALQSDQMSEFFDVEIIEDGGLERMENGEASALLILPEGFTRSLLEGTPTSLSLIRNPSERILPEIAEQTASILAEILDTGSHALREPLEDLSGLLDSDQPSVSDPSVAALAVSFNHVIQGASEFVLPPVITLEVVDLEAPEGEGSPGGNPSVFLFVLPGVSVFALFLLGDLAMRDILTEGQTGTLRRQLSGPVGSGTILAAKALYTATISIISIVILSASGLFLVEGGVNLPGFFLLSFSLVLLVTGTAAFVYGAARTERQGATIASVVYLFLAFLGGSFFQVEGLPRVVRAIAPFTPFYWATEGYRELIVRGGGVAEILTNVALLFGLGIVLMIVGSRLLRFRLLRGWA